MHVQLIRNDFSKFLLILLDELEGKTQMHKFVEDEKMAETNSREHVH